MRFYKLKRETLQGAFSLSNTELRVGNISDTKGDVFKGTSLYGGLHGPLVATDRAVVLSDLDAKVFVSFLERLQNREIPTYFSVSVYRLETFRWGVAEFLSKWHDGGGYSGQPSVRYFAGIRHIPATITADAAKNLRECIADFYNISPNESGPSVSFKQ